MTMELRRCIVAFFFHDAAIIVVLLPLIQFKSLFTLVDAKNVKYKPDGIQSGPDPIGSTFVSSAIYSPIDNSVLLTGNTWGRFFESVAQRVDEDYDEQGMKINEPVIPTGCFVADISLPSNSAGGTNTMIQFISKQRLHIGDVSQNEVCNAIHLYNRNSEIMIIGHSEHQKDGVLDKQEGMILDLNYNVNGDKSFSLHGGKMLEATGSRYPMNAVNFDGDDKTSAYVAFMEANNQVQHLVVQEGSQQHHPSKYFSYGAGFGLGIARYDLAELKQQQEHANSNALGAVRRMYQSWFFGFEIDGQGKAGDVCYVTDIIAVGGQGTRASPTLLIAGSTNGKGRAFGETTLPMGNTNDYLDGYVAKVHPTTAEMIGSIRIFSKENREDWIAGLCHAPSTIDVKHFYIVGHTAGNILDDKAVATADEETATGGYKAFLMKMDVVTLRRVWTKQLGASGWSDPAVRGMACSVTPDGKSIWMGGIVENDGVISESGLSSSAGGKDIFLARYTTRDGIMEFVHQMGTSEDDELALRGGLVTDNDGNAVLIGTTYGSLYRDRSPEEHTADVFVLTVSRATGEVKAPINHGSGLSFLLPLLTFDITAATDSNRRKLFYVFLVASVMLVYVHLQNRGSGRRKAKNVGSHQTIRVNPSSSRDEESSSMYPDKGAQSRRRNVVGTEKIPIV